MPEPLTKRQSEVYEFVIDYITANGFAPTVADICSVFELSSLATAHKHLKNLQAKGYIRRSWNRPRGIELVWQGDCCPTCGQPKPTETPAEASV